MAAILAFFTSSLGRYLMIGIAAAAIAAFLAVKVTHSFDSVPLNKETSLYNAEVAGRQKDNADAATALAKANADALNQRQLDDAALSAANAKAAADKAAADARSKKLEDILNNAKPGDIRAIGPAVQSWLNELHNTASNPAPSGN